MSEQSDTKDGEMVCPSCGCVVDDEGKGHHSVADCVFMKISMANESRQREAVKVLEEANAAASKLDHEGRSNWDYNSMRVYQEAVDKALAILKGESNEAG